MASEDKRSLGLLDATLLVSGSMIGSGIFIVSTIMLRDIGSPAWLLVLWVLTGLITIFAALSYGELAGMMPNAGGQYVYIQRAYGKMTSFLLWLDRLHGDPNGCYCRCCCGFCQIHSHLFSNTQ